MDKGPAAVAPIAGADWTVDWRGSVPVEPIYLSAGEGETRVNPAQATHWNPYTGLVTTDPVIEGYGDPSQLQALGIGNRLEAGSFIGYPGSGQMGPNSQVPLIDIANEAGVDVGLTLWTGPGPRMVFLPPPSYSEQTTPISAIGI